jgi:hypothetical protein
MGSEQVAESSSACFSPVPGCYESSVRGHERSKLILLRRVPAGGAMAGRVWLSPAAPPWRGCSATGMRREKRLAGSPGCPTHSRHDPQVPVGVAVTVAGHPSGPAPAGVSSRAADRNNKADPTNSTTKNPFRVKTPSTPMNASSEVT